MAAIASSSLRMALPTSPVETGGFPGNAISGVRAPPMRFRVPALIARIGRYAAFRATKAGITSRANSVTDAAA